MVTMGFLSYCVSAGDLNGDHDKLDPRSTCKDPERGRRLFLGGQKTRRLVA